MLRILLVLLICSSSVANAEIIEFDLTGLTGNGTDSLQVDSLVYSGPTAVVHAVHFRLSGSVNDLGEIRCGGEEAESGETWPWFMTWWGTIDKSNDYITGKWVAHCPDYLDQATSFNQTSGASSQNGFSTVASGDVITAVLYFGKGDWVGECDLLRSPSGTVFNVTVVMDVFYPLPAQDTSWGRLKVLFD